MRRYKIIIPLRNDSAAYQRKDYPLRLNGIHNIRIALFKQII